MEMLAGVVSPHDVTARLATASCGCHTFAFIAAAVDGGTRIEPLTTKPLQIMMQATHSARTCRWTQ